MHFLYIAKRPLHNVENERNKIKNRSIPGAQTENRKQPKDFTTDSKTSTETSIARSRQNQPGKQALSESSCIDLTLHGIDSTEAPYATPWRDSTSPEHVREEARKLVVAC
jgi:hypothetical protein